MRRAIHACLLLAICGTACAAPAETAPPVPSAPAATASATLPATASPVPAAPTPSDQIYLSDLEPLVASVGWGSLGRGVYPNMEGVPGGQPIRSHGTTWSHGLFAHAPSRIEYELGGAYRSLSGSVLIHDGGRCGDGVVFRVLVDEREVFASPAIRYDSPPVAFTADLPAGQVLSLVVDLLTGGDCDWSVWGDPLLTRAEHIFTPTVDPNLPCGGTQPERVYLFLACEDILRIRGQLAARDPQFLAVWGSELKTIDQWRTSLPTTYNNMQSSPLLWGGNNYYLRDLTLIYLVTGKKTYADSMKTVLDLIQRSVPNTPRAFANDDIGALVSHPHHGVNANLSVLFAYLALRDTDYYSDADRAFMDGFMIRQGETALTAIPALGGHVSLDSWINRNVSLASAILAVASAAAFPDDPRAQALYPRARAELDWMLANWWESDGGWGENTDSYGIARLDNLLQAVEAVRRNLGEDMYAQGFGGQTIRNLCRYYLKVVTPEGYPPALNDSQHVVVDPGVLRLCAYRSNDAELAFAADQYRWGSEYGYGQPVLYGDTLNFNEVAWSSLPPVAQQPNFTSVVLEGTGAAVLRTGWFHTDSYSLLQYSDSLVHAEKSFGALFLYDGGPWLVANGYHLPGFNMDQDPGTYNEGQSTRQHSTITLDNSTQENIGGDLRAFADLGRVGIASVQGRPYSFADFSRTLLWMKDFHTWLVVDDIGIRDGGTHSLQVRWYVRTDRPGAQDLSQPANWQFTRLQGDPVTLQVAFLLPGTANYQAIQRHYPYEQWISDAQGVEMSVAGVSGSARAVTALTSADFPARVTRSDEPGGTVLSVLSGDEFWDWFLPAPGKESGSLGGWSVSGQAACLNRIYNDSYGYCLMDGTVFSYNGQPFVQSSAPVYVEAYYPGGWITVSAAEAVEMSLYWPGDVLQLVEGDRPVSFTREGELLQLSLPAGAHGISVR